ncbi:unnamed protein product [Fraxinus pennsylvanica]|uniref:Uncharacterized protein n=1 Tax=Fraxinus pennsylvanica TaxID=56036 RepID=A0AAD2DQ08_9LAMI|nr:unnamed protein product [Fraxinus pennsylvanica]
MWAAQERKVLHVDASDWMERMSSLVMMLAMRAEGRSFILGKRGLWSDEDAIFVSGERIIILRRQHLLSSSASLQTLLLMYMLSTTTTDMESNVNLLAKLDAAEIFLDVLKSLEVVPRTDSIRSVQIDGLNLCAQRVECNPRHMWFQFVIRVELEGIQGVDGYG